MEAKGKRIKRIAHSIEGVKDFQISLSRGHDLSATCVALSGDEHTAFTGSKDASIIKCKSKGIVVFADGAVDDVETGKKLWRYLGNPTGKAKNPDGHVGHVLAVAVSSDGRFLASGGMDNFVKIWDTRTNDHFATFKGHRDAISVGFFVCPC
jgi:ribosomal RNA-processing protein 9